MAQASFQRLTIRRDASTIVRPRNPGPPRGGPMVHPTPLPAGPSSGANPDPVVSGGVRDILGRIGDAAVDAVADRIRRSGGGMGPGGPPPGQFPGAPSIPGFNPPGSPPGAFDGRHGSCTPPLVLDQGGGCVFPNSPGDISTGGTAPGAQGAAVHGRFGVGVVAQSSGQVVLTCPRGMVLGLDNICYNKRDLRRDERKWVPARKPLLTGGDLNAITRANRAAKALKRQKKKLKTIAKAFDL